MNKLWERAAEKASDLPIRGTQLNRDIYDIRYFLAGNYSLGKNLLYQSNEVIFLGSNEAGDIQYFWNGYGFYVTSEGNEHDSDDKTFLFDGERARDIRHESIEKIAKAFRRKNPNKEMFFSTFVTKELDAISKKILNE